MSNQNLQQKKYKKNLNGKETVLKKIAGGVTTFIREVLEKQSYFFIGCVCIGELDY